jgi:hypothetical protein
MKKSVKKYRKYPHKKKTCGTCVLSNMGKGENDTSFYCSIKDYIVSLNKKACKNHKPEKYTASDWYRKPTARRY